MKSPASIRRLVPGGNGSQNRGSKLRTFLVRGMRARK
jgi:hypothetical protein